MSLFYQFTLVFLSAGLFVVANSLAAQWAKTNNNFLWIPISALSVLGYFLFGVLIKQTNLSITAGMVDAFIVIGSIFVGLFIFKDIVTPLQITGLVFACLAVIILIFS